MNQTQPEAKTNRSKLSIIIGILSIVLYFFINPPSYVFSPEEMKEIAKIAIDEGLQHQQSSSNNATHIEITVQSVVRQLYQRFPGRILPHPQWMFNNAGGAMGSMLVLHCSLVEYVIIFGTALGTEGHTGRFMADDYFTILSGEQWAYEAGSLRKKIYYPGDQHVMARGTAKQYKMPDGAWALEYARGNILSMLPFGFADSLTSTLDFVALGQTIYVSAYGIIRELLFKR